MHSTAALVLLGFFAVSMVSSYSARLQRSIDAGQPKELTPTDLALANVSHAATSTKMDLMAGKLDRAVESAEELKLAAEAAHEKGAISRDDVEVIKKTAVKVEKAAEIGDHPTALIHAEKLNQHMDKVAVSQKGDEVAEKLKKADDQKDKPVLITEHDVEILRAAVAEVVAADHLVPPEKKAEATEFAVKTMKEGFEKGNVTNDQLVRSIEVEASRVNMTNATETTAVSDRSWGDNYYHKPWWYHRHHRGRWWDNHGRWWDRRRNRWWDHDHHRHRDNHHHDHDHDHHNGNRRFGRENFGTEEVAPVSYDPYYYNGHGFKNCLYWSSYRFCRSRLFGDYAYYNRFHNFYRRHRS